MCAPQNEIKKLLRISSQGESVANSKKSPILFIGEQDLELFFFQEIIINNAKSVLHGELSKR